MRISLLLLIIIASLSATLAQDSNTVEIKIFANREQLVIYHETNDVTISIEQMLFEVNLGGETQENPLLGLFTTSELQSFDSATCFRLLRSGASQTWPEHCLRNASNLVEVIVLDPIWWNSLGASKRSFQIYQGSVMIDFCANGTAVCSIDWPINIPSTLTPTVENHTGTPTDGTPILMMEARCPFPETQVYIPNTTFMMGSSDNMVDEDELPVHSVSLDAYCIDKYEVTNADYLACENSGKCAAPVSEDSYSQQGYYGDSKFLDYPVVNVKWIHSDIYCRELRNGRLPTEAQWELAARLNPATNDLNLFSWGSEPVSSEWANYADSNIGDTVSVGEYPPSQTGVYDLGGNVAEWVRDWYGPYPLGEVVNPTGPTEAVDGTGKVIRGGSFQDTGLSLLSTNRDHFDAEMISSRIGFRCVTEPLDTISTTINRNVVLSMGPNLPTLSNAQSTKVTFGDVNRDGLIDMLISGNPSEIWINQGSGDFTLGAELNARSNGDLGDINNDGYLDTFFAGPTGSADNFWINDGSGNFSGPNNLPGGYSGRDAELADLNNDGWIDAVVANHRNQPNQIWINNGGSFIQGPDLISSSGLSNSRRIALADLDLDGDIDIFVANDSNQPNTVWLNDGNFTFRLISQLGNSSSNDVDLADLTGDGLPDAFVINAQPSIIWRNLGGGNFEHHQTIETGTYSVALGDLNSDNFIDAFIANQHANVIWLNDGVGLETSWLVPLNEISAITNYVAVADVDDDGDLDAVAANDSANTLYWNLTR